MFHPSTLPPHAWPTRGAKTISEKQEANREATASHD